MPRPRHPELALAALATLVACASPAPRAPVAVAFARELPVPAAIAAAVVGGALREALPDGDPLPASSLVVVEPAAGGFLLAWDRRGDGWLPLGSHRLGLRLANPPERPLTTRLLPRCHEGPTAGHRPGATIELRITAAAGNCRLEGTLPADVLSTLQRACDRLAAPTTTTAGLQEPNLALWTTHRLAATACADERSAATARAAAARLMPLAADVHEHLVGPAARRGDLAAASDHAWQAMLATGDPRHRAVLGARLWELQSRRDDAAAWRAAARRCEDEATADARALLHTARRLAPRPELDYRLASDVHRRHADGDLAHATALLAREHAGVTLELTSFIAELTAAAAGPPTAAAAAAPSR